MNETLDIRTMKIKKMRQTKHNLKPRTIVFTDKGLEVLVRDEILK